MTAAWKKANPDKVKASGARYRSKNKIKIEAYRESQREDFNRKLREKRLANIDTARAKAREYRKSNGDRIREYDNNRRVKSPAVWQLKTARKRARTTGVAFDLDREWFNERLSRGCEMSGLPFDFKVRSPNLASIDRKDPKGPYTKENCRLILWWINRALSNLGDEYALTVFRAIFVKRGEIADYEDRMAA